MTNRPIILGIHGHSGAGKDTICNFLCNNYANTWREAFADPLKAACAAAFNIPVEHFNDQDKKNLDSKYWGVTPKEIAQFVGTELFRDNISKLIPDISENFWVSNMSQRLFGEDSKYDSNDIVIIPDLRFQNEYDWLMENNGFLIHVTRPGSDGLEGLENHRSEAGFEHHQGRQRPGKHYCIYNTQDLSYLYQLAANFFHSILIHKLQLPEVQQSTDTKSDTDQIDL